MSVARRIVLCCAPTMIMIAGITGPVLAHIDPDPVEAPAGSQQSVGFTVEHGCAGSPTVELRMQLPDGVADATPEAPNGWTGSVEDNVVSFTGGPLADDVEETFRVRMILPLTPDTTIYFPFVQRCEVGEVAWIDVPTDGSGTELDEPAPAMALTAALPGTTAVPVTTTTLAATTTTQATTGVATSTVQNSVSTPDSAGPTTADPTPAASQSPPTTPDGNLTTTSTNAGASEGDTGSGSTGTVVLIVAVMVVLVGGAVLFIRARRPR